MNNRIIKILSCIISLVPNTLFAATATTTFAVTATVVATCTVTATGIAFGNYTSVLNDATGTITPICTNGTPYTIGLDKGTTGTTVTTRQMQGGGGGVLNYGLYQDSSHAINWGNTPGTDTPASVNGNGIGQPVTVYGRIPAGQAPTPGAYSDTITVTVNY